MASELRILIFTARFGGGHKTAAEALAAAFEREAPGASVEVMDYFDAFVSPVTTLASTVAYTQSVRLFPLGYRLFYETTRDLSPDSTAQQWMNSLGRSEVSAYLAEHPADAIVSVHPTPAGALAELKLAGKLNARLITVVTDFVVHNQWIHTGTDLYLVGSDSVRAGLIERGVPADAIRVTGIPVRINTDLLAQREALREKWGLRPERPTVMVMVGAQGMMRKPWRLFHAIADLPIQGFFLCGKDRALHARLNRRAHRYPDFRVLPFVRVVPELMTVSDLLVSKAGGLTSSEALAMELPMLILHPIPGQEWANRDYLVGAGAARSCDTLAEMREQLMDICARPEQLDEMRRAIRMIRRPEAAGIAARLVCEMAAEGDRCRAR